MRTTLPQELLPELLAQLEGAHKQFKNLYPGVFDDSQPVHTYYEGAQLFRSDIIRQSSKLALCSLDEFAPDFISFAKAIALSGVELLSDPPDAAAAIARSIEANPERARRDDWPVWFAHTVYRLVREKLQREPIEDLRIDFEDGYGNHSDAEEDGHAACAANEIAAALNSGELWPAIGIRIKPFSKELCKRSVRTLDIFLTELATKMRVGLPEHILITLAKVNLPDEVAALANICSRLEPMLGFAPGSLRIELMIETTQSVFNERGEVNLLPLVSAARGRSVAAHFGTYDYTAGRNLTAADQHMLHQACDFAREVMQVALAGTGIWLSDGGTNILPIPRHRAANGGTPLSQSEIAENRDVVHHAWRLHFDHVRHSLENGYYQGWDLHPAQLPTRYAAVISFFLENMDAVSQSLRNFIDEAARVRLFGQVFDDAGAGQGLLNYFRRAIHCGAITVEEAQLRTGLTPEEIRTGSFRRILAGRRG